MASPQEMSVPLPKMETLKGSVHIEWKRCGRANCRCLSGRPHGPYYARRWREEGRQRKAYVAPSNLEATMLAIELRRQLIPSACEMKRRVGRSLAGG